MLVDLKPLLSDKVVCELFSYCIFEPTEAKINQVIELYRNNSNLFIWGYSNAGRITGIIGVDIGNPERHILKHIAVATSSRGKGIAKSMISELGSISSLKSLEAETDDDAVGFYRECGFRIINLGEKYPGVTRYLCVLNKD